MFKERYMIPIRTAIDRYNATAYVRNELLNRPTFHQVSRKDFIDHWDGEDTQEIAGGVWDATRSPQPQQVSYRVQRLILGSMRRLARRGLLQQYLEKELNRDALKEILDICREVGDPENSRRNPEVGEAFHRICVLLGLNADSEKVQ